MFDHFGLIAPLYDRVIRLKTAQKIVRLAGLPTEGRLLDAGGGTGRVTQELRHLVSSVVILDESLGMLRQATNKGGLAVVCAPSERMPFGNATFERVLMVDALHHVANQRETIAEMWRVLKPGGRIVVEEPDIGQWTVRVVALLEKLALMRSHFLAPQVILEMFLKNDPSAQGRIEREGFNAWVIVEKPLSGDAES